MFMQDNTEAVRLKMWEITKIFNKSGSDRILSPIYISRVRHGDCRVYFTTSKAHFSFN